MMNSFNDTLQALKVVSDMKVVPYLYINSVLGFLVNIRLHDYFIVRSYLKWVDDEVDSEGDAQEKLEFLNRQREFLRTRTYPLPDGKQALVEYVAEMLATDPAMQALFNDFFERFEFDIKRKHQQVSEHKLNEHILKLGVTALKVAKRILDKNDRLRFDPHDYNVLAVSYIFTDMLLDLKHDLPIGYINIPSEVADIRNTGDIEQVRRIDTVRSWIGTKVGHLEILHAAARDILARQRFSIQKIMFKRILMQRGKAKLSRLKVKWRQSVA